MTIRSVSCLAALFALAGCVETVPACSEPGFVRDPERVCRNASQVWDGGRDAGDSGTIRPDGGPDGGPDTGPPDAGPCGVCSDPARPYCGEVLGNTYECVECTAHHHCDGGFCENNECVECREHADCTDPTAAQCNTAGRCVPCENVTHCPAERQQCDTARSPATCVQCTSSAQCAGGRSCNLLTGECVEGTPFSRATCTPCSNDDQCATVGASISRCIQLAFEGSPHGYYCLPQIPAVGGCLANPFTVGVLNRRSLNGELPANYCGINQATTTCDAVRALIERRACPGGDDDCPDGGFCRDLGGGAATDRCTYACSEPSQCLSESTHPNEFTCGTGSAGGSEFCGG